MEIRATEKDYKIFKKLNKHNYQITKDASIEVSVVMVQNEGKLVEWFKGKKEIISLLKYGYLRVKKDCPYRYGKCICEKCSLYVIQNNVGDCSNVWSAVIK